MILKLDAFVETATALVVGGVLGISLGVTTGVANEYCIRYAHLRARNADLRIADYVRKTAFFSGIGIVIASAATDLFNAKVFTVAFGWTSVIAYYTSSVAAAYALGPIPRDNDVHML